MSELGKDPRPALNLPREMIPIPVAIGLGSVMAVGLLIYLLSNRESNLSDQAISQTSVQVGSPELIIPEEKVLLDPQKVASQVRELKQLPNSRDEKPSSIYPQVKYILPPRRLSEIENSEPSYAIEENSEPRYAIEENPAGGLIVIDLYRAQGDDRQRNIEGEDGFERPRREDETVAATQIRNRAMTIIEGAIIAAVLETPLNSDRPGLARAIVSQDVRGFDGTRVLIPRGSRLIGEFKAEVTPGLRRIPVIWTRLVRPDGVAIKIGSPGADALGGAGIGGRVNTHLAQRLLGAVLQSALTIGVNVVSSLPSNGGSPVFVGLPGQAQQVGEQLVPKVDRAPTVKVREGAEISVFVARDLDFSRTPVIR